MSKILESYLLAIIGICTLSLMVMLSMMLQHLLFLIKPEYSGRHKYNEYYLESVDFQKEIKSSNIPKNQIDLFVSKKIENEYKNIRRDSIRDIINFAPSILIIMSTFFLHLIIYLKKRNP